ncbi:MAG: hypothetical protein FJX76_21235 [Armatimonadetes bacterium]|nr:hypothetical protein [Armatimonadota bacterium]
MDAIRSGNGPLIQSPYRASAPVGAAVCENDAVEWSTGTGNAHPMRLAPEAAAVDAPAMASVGKKIGIGVALALTGFGILAGTAQPAHAQQPTSVSTVRTTSTDTRAREAGPVHVGSVDEVVEKFSRERQLYIVGQPALNGRPLSTQEIEHFKQVLADHPNVYVVLVDKTTDVGRDDNVLSRGIANSHAFQSVAQPDTGEKDGVVFMIYTNVNENPMKRKVFMRSEELPDRLNVGEANFAAEDGTPGPLMEMFIDAFKNQQKDLAGSLQPVMQQIIQAVNAHVERTVGPVREQIALAQTALAGAKPEIKKFQDEFGKGGQIGDPDVAGWEAQLDAAREAVSRDNLPEATRLSQAVVSAVSTQQAAMSGYRQAPAQIQALKADLARMESALQGLEDNAGAREARKSLDAAGNMLARLGIAFNAKDTSYTESLKAAQEQAESASQHVQASRQTTRARLDHEKTMRNVRNAVLGGVTLAVLVVTFLLNRRARHKKAEAEEALQKAIADIGARAQELMALLNQSDVHEVAAYEG